MTHKDKYTFTPDLLSKLSVKQKSSQVTTPLAPLLPTPMLCVFMLSSTSGNTVKNVVCPAHHFAVTPVECMHTFKLSVAITPNYVVCMHTL